MTNRSHLPRKPKRKPKETLRLQGRNIITEDDLDEVFADVGEVEKPEVYTHRKILHGVVLTLLVALIIAAVLTALAVVRGDFKIPGWSHTPAPEATCPAAVHEYPPTDSITVNVYNGTQEEGLAGQTSGLLAKRGYQIGEVASKRISHSGVTAVVISGPAGEANAFNLQRNIPETEYVADQRADASVDVVLGKEFKQLVPEDRVDLTAGPLSCPRLSPEPSKVAK
ncbi:LytR C-terminal domain-containing protein [Arthrobacter sp. VKM Ac-2550]|uniref:LytR C-terminal domain-containing protein n=1 Tax=Crystallibacter permensis TaxID=1938888 RepID=UPI00222615E6|nr:LytR C-terminal domain-containing protein [Arthrobacter sp. VKM Ac-2550]MCW2130916.1 LytR cell envelope-related transcriptional attenuator [Arthrobacter sp. VKM Ac-2550]